MSLLCKHNTKPQTDEQIQFALTCALKKFADALARSDNNMPLLQYELDLPVARLAATSKVIEPDSVSDRCFLEVVAALRVAQADWVTIHSVLGAIQVARAEAAKAVLDGTDEGFAIAINTIVLATKALTAKVE